MKNLFEAIAKRRFLVLGRAGIDLFADPIGTKSEVAETFHADLGGSSANICAGLCKLGAEAALLTSVSDDAVGRFVVNRLKHYGVNTDYVKVVGGELRTSLAFYESVLEDFQNVIYRNGAADFQVTEADVDKADYSAFSAVITAGTVFASEPARSATFRALDHAKSAGLPIIFDVDYRPYSWPSADVAADVLTRAGEASDLIIGNDEEFDFMAGAEGQGFEKARSLSNEKGCMVIYKMGHKGAVTFWQGDEIRTGIYPVDAIKPVGAGDSFCAGLLTAMADNFPLQEAVLRGSACAAIVVSKPGCAPAIPTRAELDAFMQTHPGPSEH